MTTIDSNDSVQNEQFGEAENKQEADKLHEPADKTAAPDNEVGKSSSIPTENNDGDNNEELHKPNTVDVDSENTARHNESEEIEDELTTPMASDYNVDNENTIKEQNAVVDNQVSVVESEQNDDDKEVVVAESEQKEDLAQEASDEDNTDEEAPKPTEPKYEPEQIDFTKLSKDDLVKVLKDLISKGFINEIRNDVEQIKTNFYKKHKAEIESKKEKFLSDGGAIQDFKMEITPLENELKELLNQYRDLRSELVKRLEGEKNTNLKIKYEIIDKIKELVNSQESLNKTFHEFRDLQNQWREVGPVPQQNIKELWDSYHYHVEGFYDYIKINKELRDLDFKKNLEAKIKLSEQAEELLLEPSVVEAFRQLQKLHEQWREVGPIPVDKRSEMWDRFKDATTKINKKHQEYFVLLKQEQKKNYDEKLVLCEKAEEIAQENPESYSEWDKKSKELVELQKVWKTIGFAPKKYNTQIYERFRKACDSFFNSKREFYSQNREEQNNHLQLKTELCMQAEAIQGSTDWKKTTAEFIALQKKWKEIGPVSSKQSEKIWKRFRAACDTFFNNKSAFYSNIDSSYEDNLAQKNKLIEEIQNFEFSDNVEQNLNALKNYQRQWSEIGFVPIKSKNEVQERYRKAINDKFDRLKLDDNRKSIIKYRSRIEGIQEKPNSDHRLHMEREKCFTKLKQLENDITLWENNIGFFANSQNAESMIRDVENKVADAKQRIEQLKSKIRILDEYEK